MDIEEARRLITELAGMTKDGELGDDGEEYVMENDDAWESIMGMISWARRVLGQPEDRPRGDGL